jgi:hypothetical protein
MKGSSMRILSKTMISSSVFLAFAVAGIANASPDMDTEDAMAEAAMDEPDAEVHMDMMHDGDAAEEMTCDDEANCDADEAEMAEGDEAAGGEEAAPAAAASGEGAILTIPGSTAESGGGGSADPGGPPVKD